MLKTTADYILAIILLAVLSPVMLLLALSIWLFIGSPILFKQTRPGLNGKIFTIYKFRTMLDASVGDDDCLSDEQRMLTFGSFLRRTSLDELPQLFNVLKGDISFVGPRALLVEYLPLYNESQKMRHSVKPGITGWAQVNGRNNLCWEKKFELDLWYVNNQSLALDMKILFLTFFKVISRKDISASNHVTMEKFTGSNNERS